jgi:hypothetical protein
MVLITEGEFLFGNDNVTISLPAFYIDKYEVTTQLYASFMQATNHNKPEHWGDVRPELDGTNLSLELSGQMPMPIVITTGSGFRPKRSGKRLHAAPMAEHILGEIQNPVRALLTTMGGFALRFVMSMPRSLNRLAVMLRGEAPTAFTTWLEMHGSG